MSRCTIIVKQKSYCEWYEFSDVGIRKAFLWDGFGTWFGAASPFCVLQNSTMCTCCELTVLLVLPLEGCFGFQLWNDIGRLPLERVNSLSSYLHKTVSLEWCKGSVMLQELGKNQKASCMATQERNTWVANSTGSSSQYRKWGHWGQ